MKHYETSFSEEQYTALYPDGIEAHYWTKTRNRILLKLLRKYHKNRKVLEVGCGKGIVVAHLNQHQQVDCHGIELAPVTPLPAVDKKIQTGRSVFDLPETYCEQFGTILLLDVIEHLPDPDNFLAELKNRFKNLESIIITVPARQELFSNYDEFNGHFRRYDLKMLIHHAENLNAEILMNSYFFHSLYLPARFALLLSGKRKLYLTAPSNFMKIIHGVLSQWFYWDYLCLPQKAKGTSIISIFQLKKNNRPQIQ